MIFYVKPVSYNPESTESPTCYLVRDNWNDYFQYRTMFDLYYCDSKKVLWIGKVKIGFSGAKIKQFEIFNALSEMDKFEELAEGYFSLGQDVYYYEKIMELPEVVQEDILNSLNDMVRNQNLLDLYGEEEITRDSIMRDVSRVSIRGQFKRVITGEARLTEFDFSFRIQNAIKEELTFKVSPYKNPPSNIQVLIGRNGVGKTHLLKKMLESLIVWKGTDSEMKTGFSSLDGSEIQDIFSSVVGVSFSVFDDLFTGFKDRESSNLRYEFIGLNDDGDLQLQNKELTAASFGKNLNRLFEYFFESISVINMGLKRRQWNKAIDTLESDPIFKDVNIRALTEPDRLDKMELEKYFKLLSSGHKIILLIITKLVEKVEERTLVLIDEPENHLHPPLLSAFTRALSDLLVYRNGVAIITTHSPVVLQEVPRDCTWVLNRSNFEMSFHRPEIETFGENTGILTREVFKLEVTKSGYHKLIGESVAKYDTIEEVYESFSNKLGFDAKSMVRELMFIKNDGDNNG
ncbi:ATP-binding protein [Listeria booriae]|uniref:AAA family ATPase n=1 Tax=Listeria booriae TaxID=1552123 RepID=UPI0016295C3E|nr:AAA family ATPase [Listeria booriae]MBC1574147.1 ATP-binding protein [Listeria booriae]